METIEIVVAHYYRHTLMYDFMSEAFYQQLEQAFLNCEETIIIYKCDYDIMIEKYFETLKN